MLYMFFAENLKHTDKKRKKSAIQIYLDMVACSVGGCQ